MAPSTGARETPFFPFAVGSTNDAPAVLPSLFSVPGRAAVVAGATVVAPDLAAEAGSDAAAAPQAQIPLSIASPAVVNEATAAAAENAASVFPVETGSGTSLPMALKVALGILAAAAIGGLFVGATALDSRRTPQ